MVKMEKGLPETNTAEEAGSSRIWTKTNTTSGLRAGRANKCH